MFFRKKEVAVVGGGNTAVQDALVLAEYCSRVYLIHRRNELRAELNLAEQMTAKENIEFIGETVIEEFEGEENLQSLTLRNVATGAVQYLPVSALFEAIGQLPQNAAFADLVELDEDGYFITDNTCATSCRGVFAAGDACRKNVRQLTTAVSDGTVAALSAVEYLR
jgi:thioredoxin reductase (NADPH)